MRNVNMITKCSMSWEIIPLFSVDLMMMRWNRSRICAKTLLIDICSFLLTQHTYAYFPLLVEASNSQEEVTVLT